MTHGLLRFAAMVMVTPDRQARRRGSRCDGVSMTRLERCSRAMVTVASQV
jgi:hypothetical protein